MTGSNRRRALQERAVSAALRRPAVFVDLVRGRMNGRTCPGFDAVLRQLHPSDPDRRAELVAAMLGAEPAVADYLYALQEGGETESPESVHAVLDEIEAIDRAARARKDLESMARRIAAAAADPSNSGDTLADVATKEALAAQRVAGELRPGAADAFVSAARSFRQMRENPAPLSPALLGDGLIRPPMVFLIHGEDGVGKSWAALHLVAALACGADWYGLPTRAEGTRTGYVSLEDPEPLIRTRLERICRAAGLDQAAIDARLVIVAPPTFSGELDLAAAEGQQALDRLVSELALGAAVLDHLSLCHSMPDERDFRPVLRPLLQLCRRRELVVGLLHHNRKSGPDVAPGRDRGAARGDSRLRAACRLAMSMYPHQGLVALEFTKATWAQRPETIHLARGEEGAFIAVDAPPSASVQKQRNVELALGAVVAAGSAGASKADVVAAVATVGEKTVTEYLKQLEAARKVEVRGETSRRRWYATPEGARSSRESSEDGISCDD